MGHLGTERPLQLIGDCFVWPQMQRDMSHFFHKCVQVSQERLTNRQACARMISIETILIGLT